MLSSVRLWPGAVSSSQLALNYLLRCLPTHEWGMLRDHFRQVDLAPRRFFLPAGEKMAHVYFPQSGLVSLVVPMASGMTSEVAVVGSEGMLGVSVVLEGDPPPYDMLCQVPGQALCIQTQTFTRMLGELPEFRRMLLRYALALLSHTARTAACNGLHPVGQRLARWLLLCRDRVGADSFRLTHEGLANMLATRRPFLTQTMARLHEAGLIEYQRGAIRILDGPGLEATACEDYQATEDCFEQLLGWRPRYA